MLRSNLVRHKIFHTFGKSFGRTKKNFVCQVCESSFSQKITLERHLLTHTGEKNYKCDHCDRKFSLAANLRKHVDRHTHFNKRSNIKKRSLNSQSLKFENENGIYIKIESDV